MNRWILLLQNVCSKRDETVVEGRRFLDKLVSALRRPSELPRRLRYQFDLLRDQWTFGWTHPFLKECPTPRDPSKTVLIVSLSNWVAQVKMEAMLAKALQIEGWSPVIVTTREASRSRHYYRAFGFEEFVYFDDLVQEARSATYHEAAVALEGKMTFDSLFTQTYRGAEVGRHVLSSVIRALRAGTMAFDDPQVRSLILDLLPYAYAAVLAAEKMITNIQPRAALFLEKGGVGHAEIYDIALNHGVDVFQCHHAHRADALIFKRFTQETRHFHPYSLSKGTWNKVAAMPWNAQLDAELNRELPDRYRDGTWFNRKFGQLGKHLKSAEQVRAQLGLEEDKKTAVIFSHVLWDATFFYGENLFRDYEEWLVETVKTACKNDRVNWVIKVHPDYVWKLKQLGSWEQVGDILALEKEIGKLPSHVKLLSPETDISTLSVFGVTDYGITVRGTVGIELSSMGIPVFTAGTGRYSGLGFTYDSGTRAEYLESMLRIHEFPTPLPSDKHELAKKYAYAILKIRPLPCRTFEMTQMPFECLGHPLDHNVIIRAKSWSDMASAADLRKFARWATACSDPDLLAC